MSDQLAGVFTADSVEIRLQIDVATALGIPSGANVPLYGVTLRDGWLLAEYRETTGQLTKYLLPPHAVLFVRQVRTTTTLPPPQGG